MATFNTPIVTTQGLALLKSAIAGTDTLTFTHLIFSADDYTNSTDSQVASLTDISSKDMTTIPQSFTDSNSNVKVRAVGYNQSTSQAFNIKTYALYATNKAGAELLFAVSTSQTADFVPAYNGKQLNQVAYTFNFSVASSNNITFSDTHDIAITQADLASINASIQAVQNSLAHIDLSSAVKQAQSYTDSSVSSLSSQVVSSVSSNASAINNVQSSVNANSSAIANNSSAIASNTSSLATNIANNSSAIASNATNIANTSSAISSLQSNVSTNVTSNVNSLGNQINSLTSSTTQSISAVRSSVSANSSAISSNASNIANNSNAISTNSNAVTASVNQINSNLNNIQSQMNSTIQNRGVWTGSYTNWGAHADGFYSIDVNVAPNDGSLPQGFTGWGIALLITNYSTQDRYMTITDNLNNTYHNHQFVGSGGFSGWVTQANVVFVQNAQQAQSISVPANTIIISEN